MKKCSICGTLNEDDTIYCIHCENKIELDTPSWNQVMQSEGIFDYLFENEEISAIESNSIKPISSSPPEIEGYEKIEECDFVQSNLEYIYENEKNYENLGPSYLSSDMNILDEKTKVRTDDFEGETNVVYSKDTIDRDKVYSIFLCMVMLLIGIVIFIYDIGYFILFIILSPLIFIFYFLFFF